MVDAFTAIDIMFYFIESLMISHCFSLCCFFVWFGSREHLSLFTILNKQQNSILCCDLWVCDANSYSWRKFSLYYCMPFGTAYVCSLIRFVVECAFVVFSLAQSHWIIECYAYLIFINTSTNFFAVLFRHLRK